jgi:hypothetical protein
MIAITTMIDVITRFQGIHTLNILVECLGIYLVLQFYGSLHIIPDGAYLFDDVGKMPVIQVQLMHDSISHLAYALFKTLQIAHHLVPILVHFGCPRQNDLLLQFCFGRNAQLPQIVF